MEDGGNIAKENKEMINSQTIEARHHVEELSKILTKKNKIEPWVVARMERATTDLSDVTHYLEGKKMAKGGGVGSKLKATYIPNRNIDELKTVFGQSIKGKDLIDGAYTTRKGIKQKPKMARTMFEEETYEFSKGGAVKKNGVNQFAEDEKSEGYEAKVFLGKFDGRTFKAQSTDKTWDDGTPVTKYFSRNGFKDVKLKGEYQLVDSDRGHWYIQGPRNVWYAVRHKDYGTPPFEFGKGGMMPGWKHKAKK